MGSLCCKGDNSNNLKNDTPNPAKQNNSTYSNLVNNYNQGNIAPDEEVLKIVFALMILDKFGFKRNSHSGLANAISRMNPNGSTAFRDAYLFGMMRLFEAYKQLTVLKFQGALKFVHIVLRHGEDTSSKTTFKELTCHQIALNQMLGSFKTWLLGVDLDPTADSTMEMASLAKQGEGNSIEMEIVNSMQISDIFQKIVVSIGLLKTTNIDDMTKNAGLIEVEQKVSPTPLLKKIHCIVVLNLDYSGSMAGSKWSQVCSAITNFQKVLGPDDFICCIIFNDNVQTSYLLKKGPDPGFFNTPPLKKPGSLTSMSIV